MNDISTCFQLGLSYSEYVDLITDLLASGRTTGPNQTDEYIEYTRQNLQRMRRTEKVSVKAVEQAYDQIVDVHDRYSWLVFTEAWCGDAANIIPVLAAMAKVSNRINFRLVMRDEHPEVFAQFLTNGSRSIPKLVVLNASSGEVMGTWGPRPKEAQSLFMRLKDEQVPFEKMIESLTLWYARDKGFSTVKEVLDFVQSIEEKVDN